MKAPLLLCICTLGFSLPAMSGGLIGFGLQATGASANFAEPFDEVYGFGFGGGAHLEIDLIPELSLRVTGDYIFFSANENEFKTVLAKVAAGTVASDFSVDGGRVGTLSFAVNGKLGVPASVLSPYLIAGAGTSTMSVSDINITFQGQPISGISPESETNFSALLGAGVELSLANVRLYLETKYTWIFQENETGTYIPVSLGITF